MDLFQGLDICQRYADALIDYNNQAKYMTLCGRLLAGNIKESAAGKSYSGADSGC